MSAAQPNVTSAVSDNGQWLILEPNYGPGIDENIVYKHNNGVKINFAAGLGDKPGRGSYGFQPYSSYMFSNLFKAVSNRNKLDLWISVEGDIKDLEWIKIYSDNGWSKGSDENKKAMTLNKGESFFISVDFIDIPANAKITNYMGSIIFRTRMYENVQNSDSENKTKNGYTSEEPDNNEFPKTYDKGFYIYIIFIIITSLLVRIELRKI